MMTEFQIEACKLALKNMMAKGWLDITVITDILKITGGVPDGNDLRALRLLHCVPFVDFPQRMRLEFPGLLQRVLESPTMELEVRFKPQQRLAEILIATN